MSEEEYSQEFSPNPKGGEMMHTARYTKPEQMETSKENTRRSNRNLISIEDFDPMERK